MRKNNSRRSRFRLFIASHLVSFGAILITVIVIVEGSLFLTQPFPSHSVTHTSAAVRQTVSGGPPAINRSASLYVDPNASLTHAALAWATQSPKDAATMNSLAATPMAHWFGAWSGDIQSATNGYVSNALAANQIPVLVAYNIPGRDCGSYSRGGAANSDDYKNWITNFATGIGKRRAIVVIEPDAIDQLSCYTKSQQAGHLQLLAYAVNALTGQTKAAVYLDAGHPGWEPANIIADRLKSAGVDKATGFSLNVSNFHTTAENISYGNAISKQIANKHYIIDTSRNGNGPATGAEAWCNPSGRAFGQKPTLTTDEKLADAYLWIKNPGISDGNCGPHQLNTAPPQAGVWWPQYVLSLAPNNKP